MRSWPRVLCEAALSITGPPDRFLSRVRRLARVYSIPPSTRLWSRSKPQLVFDQFHEVRTNIPKVFIIVGYTLDTSCVCTSSTQGAHRDLWPRHGQITKRNCHNHRSVATGEQRVLLVLSTCTGTLQLPRFIITSSSFNLVHLVGENPI